MKISIIASGSRGDVQPYVALGKGLAAAGYQVVVLSSGDFEGLVRGAGLEFCATMESVEAILNSPEWRKVSEGGNFLTIIQKMRQEVQARGKVLVEKLPAMLEGTDLLLAGLGGLGGAFSIAEKFNIPTVQAYVFPTQPTSAFASPLTPKIPKALNRLSFQLLRLALWQTGRDMDTIVRQNLGMKPNSFFGPFDKLNAAGMPVLYGYSPQVLPQPQDWSAEHQVTGYWFLDAEDGWEAPADLQDFLQAGAAPVYIGFGSMGSRNPEEAAEIALKALVLSGQRGIIASGWGGLKANDLPETVHMVSSLPHSWLFPKIAAVVHHGGAGTTAAGLRAGVPSIIIPFMGDQPYWGLKVEELGVGTKAIPRKKLTAENLAEAIKQAVQDKPMRQRASDLGRKIQQEDGVGNAVAVIQKLEKNGLKPIIRQ